MMTTNPSERARALYGKNRALISVYLSGAHAFWNAEPPDNPYAHLTQTAYKNAWIIGYEHAKERRIVKE